MRTLRPLLIALIAIIILPIIAAAGTTPARYECDDLAEYQETLVSLLSPADMAVILAFSESDLESLRPSELREISAVMDAWATAIDDLPAREVPYAARSYHRAFVDSLGLFANVTQAMATGGIFAALPYMDAMEAATLAMDRANAKGERYCGSLWPFGDDEGSTL